MEKRTCKVCDAREQLAREGQEYQSIIEQCGHDGTMRFLWYAPVPKNGREADRLIRAFLKAFGIKQAANGGYIHRLKDRDYQPDYSIQRKPEPPPVASLERRDAAYHKAGQHDLAIADYAKAILLDPYMGDWYYERGKIHQELGRYDAAVADYTKALKLNLDDNEAYYSRGEAFYKKGNLAKTKADLNKCVQNSVDTELIGKARTLLAQIQEQSP